LSDVTPFRRRLVAGAAILLSAGLFALYSRATWPWMALGWIGLLPWLAVLDGVRTPRQALLAGVAMAVAFELAVFGWFAFAIADYAGTPAAVFILVLGVASPLLQPQFVTVALLRTFVRRAMPDVLLPTVLITAATYVATESITPKLFGDTLGYPLYGSPWLRQGADVTGVPGLTFVMVAVNECLHAARRRLGPLAARGIETRAARRIRTPAAQPIETRAALMPLAAGLALVLLLASYGAWRCRELVPAADAESVTIGFVQANLGHYDRMAEEIGRFETVRTILDAHVAGSAPALAHPDLGLLVWPETVYPTTFGKPKSEAGAAFDQEIVDFVARARVPLMFGAYDTDDGAEYNAAFFLAPDAGAPRPLAIYRKTRLFPLTERVPALLESPRLRQALPWLGTWSAGAGARVIPVTTPGGVSIHVAPLICYDVLDPTIARAAARAGADVIITLSNDSWFAFGPGPALHMQGAAFRSIETRRPHIRATNTGISAVIDATGRTVDGAGIDERATIVASIVPERRITTLVVRFGEWVSPVAWLVMGTIVLWAHTRGHRA
jgi:apolipoprotein N-acyltransferase